MTEISTANSDLGLEGKALHRTIDFGFQVEAFLQSEIGQYLVRRAETEIESATDKLKHVDAEDPKRIRQLQHIVQVAESVQYWLAEAIQAGNAAQDELIERSD